MPIAPATRPLTRSEIQAVLQGVVDAPESPAVRSVAFWSTVAGLSSWCSVEDLDAVIADNDTQHFIDVVSDIRAGLHPVCVPQA